MRFFRRAARSAALLCAAMLTGCGAAIPESSWEHSSSDTTVQQTSASAENTETTAFGNTQITENTTFSQTQTTLTASMTTAPPVMPTVTASTHTSGSSVQTTHTTPVSAAPTTSATKPTPLPIGDLNDYIAGMTLRQKAAQMILASCGDTASAEKAVKAGVGGLCLFAGPFKNKSARQVRKMNAAFQQSASVPLLISVDEEGGTVNRISINAKLRSAPFETGAALFQRGGWELVISDTHEKSSLLLDLGVNVNLAPVCDVPLSESNYIYKRCFSLDPRETAEYIRTVVTQMHSDHLGSTLKHFPGYGGSVDTHQNLSYDNRDYAAFENGDFLPFRAGIAAGADAVMVSHNIVQCMDGDNPASLSPAVHRILREQLGFTGVIISDDLGMNAIKLFTGGENPAVAAVLAGNDLLCYADFANSVPAIVAAVQNGTIPEPQIDASVYRILSWKRSLGLL